MVRQFKSLMSASATVLVVAISAVTCTSTVALVIGQVDTFETGTTESWIAGGGPFGAMPPVPPAVTPTGGPGGVNDAFLIVTAQGGNGPGSRLTAFSIFDQWAGNYLTNGVGAISMDLRNFGQTELTIRVEVENPFAGGDAAVTNAAMTLPAGSDWMHAVFPMGVSQLTALNGTVAGALANTTVLRLLHAPGSTAAVPTAATLGVDNITAQALASAVPEPPSLLLCLVGLVLLARCVRRADVGRP